MAKKNVIDIRLVSSESRYFYTTMKNPKKKRTKMEKFKYDPIVRKHVLFKEK